MTKEEAIRANAAIDEQMSALDRVWESALAARDAAQAALDEINAIRQGARARQIENLRAVDATPAHKEK